ncbi:uncharacterized protein LOC135924076 [Gordionus sp. m RMFG-2023]|uniref:uncharacterized protein LOC135924076 n=1 Tax=Gordionus sp. m RMFG-2023 TaxID=3053472 RepID=UPI0031FD11A2
MALIIGLMAETRSRWTNLQFLSPCWIRSFRDNYYLTVGPLMSPFTKRVASRGFRPRLDHIKINNNNNQYFKHPNRAGVHNKYHDIVRQLIVANVIEQTDEDQICSPLFIIPKGNGSPRVISDFSEVSKYFLHYPFRLKSIPLMSAKLDQSSFACKIDIPIPLATQVRSFFGFKFNNTNYRYRVLPMGASFSPYCLQSIILHACAKTVKKANYNVYLDDILIYGNNENDVKWSTRSLRCTLEGWGFQIATEKSVLDPTPSITYLGVPINLTDKTVAADTNTRRRLKKCLEVFRQHSYQHFQVGQELEARVLGVVNHYAYTITGMSRLFSPYYVTMNQGHLAPIVDTYLAFRKANIIIDALAAPLSLHYYANSPVYVDASNSHIRINFWEVDNLSVAYSEACLLFNVPTHVIEHINAKEILAVSIGAIMAIHRNNEHPMIFTDSSVAYYSYGKGGSRSPSLEIILTQVLSKLGLANFTAVSQNIQCIPSEDNPADLPSRTWMAAREQLDLFEGPVLEAAMILQQYEDSLFGEQSNPDTPSLISGLSVPARYILLQGKLEIKIN